MIRVRQLVATLGLAAALAACAVHGSGSMSVETTGEVYQEPPQEAQVEVQASEARPGFVWIRGRWNWQSGQWTWLGGHWERERAGYAWSAGRWEHRGNRYVWVEGSWVTSSQPTVVTTTVVAPPPGPEVRDHREPVVVAPPPGPEVRDHRGGATVVITAYPTAAPPPPQVESPGEKAGFVWVTGRWDWKNGQWAWMNGHWERPRANMVWVAGRWELQGDRYVWVEGKWEAGAPPGPAVRDHRH